MIDLLAQWGPTAGVAAIALVVVIVAFRFMGLLLGVISTNAASNAALAAAVVKLDGSLTQRQSWLTAKLDEISDDTRDTRHDVKNILARHAGASAK